MAKMIYNKATGEILGVHIIGLHAADLIHEASNAIATGQTVNDIKFNVHAHPTLSEVRAPPKQPAACRAAEPPRAVAPGGCGQAASDAARCAGQQAASLAQAGRPPGRTRDARRTG
jgi:hypothetical protein